MSEFRQRVVHRLKALARESGSDRLVLPVGIFLLIDKEHGGDATAEELAARFRLLDFESRNVIDFYFLGWHAASQSDSNHGVRFDIEAFAACRTALREAGVANFGGNADLLLVDAVYDEKAVSLDFSRACRIDLSLAVAQESVVRLGSFLQSVIEAAEMVARMPEQTTHQGVVYAISDRLGLAIARESMLDYVLATWGTIIGAKRLAAISVRNLGPSVDLADIG